SGHFIAMHLHVQTCARFVLFAGRSKRPRQRCNETDLKRFLGGVHRRGYHDAGSQGKCFRQVFLHRSVPFVVLCALNVSVLHALFLKRVESGYCWWDCLENRRHHWVSDQSPLRCQRHAWLSRKIKRTTTLARKRGVAGTTIRNATKRGIPQAPRQTVWRLGSRNCWCWLRPQPRLVLALPRPSDRSCDELERPRRQYPA